MKALAQTKKAPEPTFHGQVDSELEINSKVDLDLDIDVDADADAEAELENAIDA